MLRRSRASPPMRRPWPRDPGPAAMKFLLDHIEGACVAAFLAICIGLFWPPDAYFGQANPLAGESNPYHVIAFALLAVLLAGGIVGRFRRFSRLLRGAWPALALVALAFISAFWSEAPELALRKATTLAETTLFAVYLLTRYELGDLVALLVKLFALAALVSFAMIIAAPDLATSHNVSHVTAWRGAFTDKNNLGGVAALAILVAIYALHNRLGGRPIAIAALVLNAVLLYLADSKTPVVALIAALYVVMLAASFRRHSGRGLVAGYLVLIVGLAGAAFIALDFTDALALLGRSPTLTSRTKIWEVTIGFFQHKPWLGYGYSGFWRQNSVEAYQVQALLQWPVPSAHNAWIEQGLWFGWLGVGLLAFVWLVAMYRVWRVLGLPQARHVLFCAALLTFIFICLLTESAFFAPAEITWISFAVGIVYLGHEMVLARAGWATAPRERVSSRPVPAREPAIALSTGRRV